MLESRLELLLAVATLVASFFLTRAARRVFANFRSRENKVGKELVYRGTPRKQRPLGGGVSIFAALLLAALAATLFVYLTASAHPDTATRAWRTITLLWVWLAGGILYAAIGFIDDWRKVNAAKGLSERNKIILQTIAAVIITTLVLLVREIPGEHATAVFLPFIDWTPLGVLFWPFGILVIVGAANAVNLTDGVDGLAGSCLTFAFAGNLLLALLLQHETTPGLVPLLAIAALLGFLALNLPKARIIMGDTGALGLGAALGTLALLAGTEWLLLLLGATFVLTTISVMLQIAVIRIFRGPLKLLRHQTTELFRPFLCTPLHHHFQWLGWSAWLILALYTGVSLLSLVLALLAFPAVDGARGAAWFWLLGFLVQAAFLVFAAVQKSVQANFFLGLERAAGVPERLLVLYKGLPVEVFGRPWYFAMEYTKLTERNVHDIAAESILWRNISEIEARAALGKIYHAHREFDDAAAQWEQIPPRNLLIRENLVMQLGDIYLKREDLLRAIKLLEQLPPAKLATMPGLPETIQTAKTRIVNMAGKLYHQARAHASALRQSVERGGHPPAGEELTLLNKELDAALRYTQDLRDLLANEQRDAENRGAPDGQDSGDLYRRMDATLAARREELHAMTVWVKALAVPDGDAAPRTPLEELAATLSMTPLEISRTLEVSEPLPVTDFTRISKASRNTLYRIELAGARGPLPAALVAKCYGEEQVTFFSACYRRERGVVQILSEAGAPVPRILGGYLGAHRAVLFMDDLGVQDLAGALAALPADDRAGRLALLRHGLAALVTLYSRALPVLPRLEREIRKIVKEVLTREYFVNTTAIALNRILALKRRQLSTAERARIDGAIWPMVTVALEAPRSFIHFEFVPGNLQLLDGHVQAVDFEQSTLGPAAFDVASLLFAPEADLSESEVTGLLDSYHELLPPNAPPTLAVAPRTLHAAAILKLVFYAGSAANFYRKFEETARLDAMEWYLRAAERLLADFPDAGALTTLLENCWPAETRAIR